MKKLSILLICFISIGCIAIGLCSCTEEERETVDKPSVSEGLHYNELIQALSEMESISKKDAGAKVAAMQLSDTTSDLEQYRIVSLPAEQNKKHYTLQFILISDEKNSDWEIQSIESAWIENRDDEDQIFLGSISFRIIDERKLECVANGDFFKISNADVSFQKIASEETETINIIPTGAHTLNSLGYLELHETMKL